jgi:tetratricopeptide (TPR) repeat protein
MVAEISETGIEPLVAPNGAPARFTIGRLGEATDFSSWSQVADLMLPLFNSASVIPASGSLRDEVEKIRAGSNNPKIRAGLALALVQDRIRYVALLMSQGGLVPATAEQTWSRRFGDCKAKTALLLGLLRELGIEAEPVLVNTNVGDAISGRLPALGIFNHVLVRAHIGGKAYWLDGTRTGDVDLDSIQVPNFGWGLPLTEHAALAHLVPRPLDIPQSDTRLEIDASAGIYAPAPARVDQVLHGDLAISLQSALSSFSKAQRQAFFQKYWTNTFDFIAFKSGSATFERTKRELHLLMSGVAKMDWTGGYFHVPDSSVGYTPDFSRLAGLYHDAPMDVAYPTYTRTVSKLHMPASFLAGRDFGSVGVDETLAGIEYKRSAKLAGDVLTVEISERSIVPEISYKDALADEARLKKLGDEDVALPLTSRYRATAADLAAKEGERPASASEYLVRGEMFLEHGKYEEAIADFTQALGLDPKNVGALAYRSIARVSLNDYDTAKRDLSAAEAIEPDNIALLNANAFIAEKKGDVSSAIDGYTKVLNKDSANSFALFHRAQLYRSDWKYDAAIRDLSEIIADDPDNVTALSFRALTYAAKGDSASAQRDIAAARAIAPTDSSVTYLDAQLAKTDHDPDREIAAYSKLLETAPMKGPVLAERAAVYLRLNRYDEALADTDRALRLGYKEVNLRVLRANIFMRRGDREAVAAEAEAMTRENPQSNFAFVAAGKTYQALGLHQKAIQALDRALAMRPDVIGYLNRADVRPFTDLDGRLADIDAALKLEPSNADALNQKAYNLVLKGDYAQALQLYDRAATIDLDPDNTRIPQGRAVALYLSGEKQKAERILTDLRSKAKSANDFNGLCWINARWDMFLKSAISDCRKALALNTKTGTDTLGFALLRSGEFDDAIAAFDKAIQESHGAFSYMGRAIAYQRKRNIAQANADRAEALKLKPDEEMTFAEYGLNFNDRSANSTGARRQTPGGYP